MKLPQDSILNLTCAPPPRLTSEEKELKVCRGQRKGGGGHVSPLLLREGVEGQLSREVGSPARSAELLEECGRLNAALAGKEVDVLLPQLGDNTKGKRNPL